MTIYESIKKVVKTLRIPLIMGGVFGATIGLCYLDQYLDSIPKVDKRELSCIIEDSRHGKIEIRDTDGDGIADIVYLPNVIENGMGTSFVIPERNAPYAQRELREPLRSVAQQAFVGCIRIKGNLDSALKDGGTQ